MLPKILTTRRCGLVWLPAALAAMLMSTTAQAQGARHACRPDDKLIGRIEISTADRPGTWWHLTRKGMEAAGIDSADAQLTTMQTWFGIGFNTLAEAVAHLVAQVDPVDLNRNGFVCAYSIRGTRAAWGDPTYAFYTFRVGDDN
jgi:ABC-type sugar transport system substrate-binding protein